MIAPASAPDAGAGPRPGDALAFGALDLLATMVASEVERVRAPERMSETAAADFLRALLARELSDRDELLARAKEFSLDLEEGASMIVARAHPLTAAEEGWRSIRLRERSATGGRARGGRS